MRHEHAIQRHHTIIVHFLSSHHKPALGSFGSSGSFGNLGVGNFAFGSFTFGSFTFGKDKSSQECQCEIAMNARFEFNLNVQIQLDSQLQTILVHGVFSAAVL